MFHTQVCSVFIVRRWPMGMLKDFVIIVTCWGYKHQLIQLFCLFIKLAVNRNSKFRLL